MNDTYLINPKQKVKLNGLQIPMEYLFRGMLITGAPGSGKTRCVLLPLLEEILRTTGSDPETKAGLLIVDPKNELLDHVKKLLLKVGRSEDLQILRVGEGVYNPLSSPFLTETECVEKIIAYASNRSRNSSQRPRGDELFWQNSMRSLLAAIVCIANLRCTDQLTFPEINLVLSKVNECKNLPELEIWLRAANLKIPKQVKSALETYYSLPNHSTRPCVMNSVASLLSFWEQSPLKELVDVKGKESQVDPIAIIDSGKIVVVACSGAAYGGSVTPFLLALKEHLFAALLSRSEIDVEGDKGWRKINQNRPVFIFADEFQSYLSTDPSTGELAALDRLRGFNAGLIAATQNLASLHSVLDGEAHATRLISLFANQVFLSNICPFTADFAGRLFGNLPAANQKFGIPLPMKLTLKESDREISTPEGRPKVTSSVLSKMRTGEFWLRLANGKIFHKKSPPLKKLSMATK